MTHLRGLARAGGSDDSEHFAALNSKVAAAQNLEPSRPERTRFTTFLT